MAGGEGRCIQERIAPEIAAMGGVAAMLGSTPAFSTPMGYETKQLVYNAGGCKCIILLQDGDPPTRLLCRFLMLLNWPPARLS